MNGLPDSKQVAGFETAPFATALGRDNDGAQVLAQGRGATAAQIAAVASEHNIPVLQDFALSQALQKMPVGTQIPEPLFKALSGLLDYLFREEAELAKQDTKTE
jgi:type III secretion system FlhB-like substrate exporter